MNTVIGKGKSQKEAESQYLTGNFSSNLNRLAHSLLLENRLAKLYKKDVTCLELYRASEALGRASHGACYFSSKSIYENLFTKPMAKDNQEGHQWSVASLACYIGITQAYLEFALHYLQEFSQFGAPEGTALVLYPNKCRDSCLLKYAEKLSNSCNVVVDICMALDTQLSTECDIYELISNVEHSLHHINENITDTLKHAEFKREYW